MMIKKSERFKLLIKAAAKELVEKKIDPVRLPGMFRGFIVSFIKPENNKPFEVCSFSDYEIPSSKQENFYLITEKLLG